MQPTRSDLARRPFHRCLALGAAIATLGALTAPAQAGPKGTITVRPLGNLTLTIDGDISDWPLDRFRKAAEQPLFPEGQNAGSTQAAGDHMVFDRARVGLFNGTTDDAFQANDSDFGSTVYFAHDSRFLYILAVFIDDVLRDDRDTSEHGSAGYLNDGFEFFLDTRGDSTDCISDDEFPNIDQGGANVDDFQVTVGLNANFRPQGAADNVLGARQTVERAGNLDLIGPEKGGPGGIYRDALTAIGGPDIAARRYADLRAAGARNPEIAAKPNVTFTGYAIEMRIPFASTIPGFTPDHAMGFELFWRDVDGDEDPGQGGGGISWATWGQSTEVPCDNPEASLFHTRNWGSLVFDQTDFLGPAP
jgi:hypothetical protein